MLIPRKPVQLGRDPYKVLVVITGQPKVGKTTLACSDPTKTTVLLATEEGYLSVPGTIPVPITSWSVFIQALDELAVRPDIHRIVIDTYGKLAKMAKSHACDKLKVGHPSDAGYGKGWDFVDATFFDGMTKLKNLGKQVIMICHTKDGEEDIGGKTRNVKRIEASGAASRWLDQECHARVYYEKITNPATGKAKRLLWFSGRDDVELDGRYLETATVPKYIEIPAAPQLGKPIPPGWPLVQHVLQECFVPKVTEVKPVEAVAEAKTEKEAVTSNV